jgi:hypothetical protein
MRMRPCTGPSSGSRRSGHANRKLGDVLLQHIFGFVTGDAKNVEAGTRQVPCQLRRAGFAARIHWSVQRNKLKDGEECDNP